MLNGAVKGKKYVEMIKQMVDKKSTIKGAVKRKKYVEMIKQMVDKKSTIHSVSNWQMYVGLGCIMIGIVGIAIAFVFACC